MSRHGYKEAIQELGGYYSEEGGWGDPLLSPDPDPLSSSIGGREGSDEECGGFCRKCPDHEACASGMPCILVQEVNDRRDEYWR